MSRLPDSLDISGPIEAEVFVVWLNSDHMTATREAVLATGEWLDSPAERVGQA